MTTVPHTPLRSMGKAYEHYIGKALPTCSYSKNSLLTALGNCKARMVGCQYMISLVPRPHPARLLLAMVAQECTPTSRP